MLDVPVWLLWSTLYNPCGPYQAAYEPMQMSTLLLVPWALLQSFAIQASGDSSFSPLLSLLEAALQCVLLPETAVQKPRVGAPKRIRYLSYQFVSRSVC